MTKRSDAPTLEQFANQQDTLAELRRANGRLSKQLARAKTSQAELVDAVYRAAKDAATGLIIPPVKKPAADRRQHGTEVAVAMVGDWQLGKVTPTYNSEVCEQRIGIYADKIRTLTNIQRSDHPVKELRVWLLGDIIEGVNIFPGQHWLVDSGLYRQITVDGPRILTTFLRSMLADFERVHVTAVIGNHGRLGRKGDTDPESNGDRMLYRIVQQLMADEDRLTWTIPDGMGERHWYAIDRIGNYSSLLCHGDQIRGGFAGFPFYGLAKKVWGWKAGAIPEQFDDVAFGHWHQNTEVTLNSTIARCNGSTESFNTYAQENLAAMGRPSQRMMFVHPKHGEVTCEYKVWLADK